MTYFYNSSTGGFANESPPSLFYFQYETQLHLGQGWHAYGTLAEMDAAIKKNNWPPPDASKGLTSSTSTLPSTPTRAANAAASGISNSVLGPLYQGNIWLRVGEVVFGLILVAVGLAKMTNAVPVATKVAKAVA